MVLLLDNIAPSRVSEGLHCCPLCGENLWSCMRQILCCAGCPVLLCLPQRLGRLSVLVLCLIDNNSPVHHRRVL